MRHSQSLNFEETWGKFWGFPKCLKKNYVISEKTLNFPKRFGIYPRPGEMFGVLCHFPKTDKNFPQNREINLSIEFQ